MNAKRILLPVLVVALAWPASAQAETRITATPLVTTWSPLVVGITDSQSQGGQIIVRCRATAS